MANLMNHYRFSQRWLHQPVWFQWLVPAVVLIIGVYVTPLASVVLALGADGILRMLAYGWQQQAFDWRAAIGQENNRMLGVYRFFNLFTNVPMLKGVAKRRKYMDGLLRLVTIKPENTYLYLYTRHGSKRGVQRSIFTVDDSWNDSAVLYSRNLVASVAGSAVYVLDRLPVDSIFLAV